MTVISFKSYTETGRKICSWIGLIPYTDDTVKSSVWKNIYFWISYIVLVICVIGETIYLIKTFGNDQKFLEMTALAPCMGFCFLGLTKSTTIWLNRSEVTNLMGKLQKMFPTSKNDQKKWNVQKYLTESNILFMLFSSAIILVISVFNFSPFLVSSKVFLNEGYFPKEFPYLIWYPFDPYQEGFFEIIYLIHIWAGFTAAFGILGPDIMFCSIITQICLQSDILSEKLLNYVPQNRVKDHQFINECVENHNLLIELTSIVDQIFSKTMFLNFIGSCAVICLVGFQATADVSSVDMFKFIIFLFALSVQIYIICLHGEKIIESSHGIGDAIYHEEWYFTDIQYKKYLVLIIRRAQGGSKLTAYNFFVVSLKSFMEIFSASYKFYSIIHIFYQRLNS